MTRLRATILVTIVSIGAYTNSVGNGFAIDDEQIIESNPVVTTPILGQALLGRYWPVAREGAGLYRPLVTTAFALEWRLFRGSPLGFHAVNVVAHATVSVLLLMLLTQVVPTLAALCGALVFAVHPVHVEAVANVVGLSELLAAGLVLTACIVYMRGDAWGEGGPRRFAAMCVLYLAALGAKESAAVLPALLPVLELVRPSSLRISERLRRAAPLYLSLVAVLGGYLILRAAVLGTVSGEVAAPWLRDAGTGGRVLIALSLWPQYMRLLFFPLDLASDYAPDVVPLPEGVTTAVVLGAALLVTLPALAIRVRRRAPMVTLGIAWFYVTVATVSNLFFPAGLIMAERTLYLPSVALALGVAGVAARVMSAPRLRTAAAALGLTAVALLAVRTVLRNPTWLDSYTVVSTLAAEHPESYVVWRTVGWGQAQRGDAAGAQAAYEQALALAPGLYGLLVEVAEFYGSRGSFGRAEELLGRAIALRPGSAEAYILLSDYMIRQSRGQDGHRTALAGLARAGPRRELFSLVSESYIAKGDLEAAVRARLAALGQSPGSGSDWDRLADLYEALGRSEEARAARARRDATTR